MAKTKTKSTTLNTKTGGKLLFVAYNVSHLITTLLRREVPEEPMCQITQLKDIPIFKEAGINATKLSGVFESQESAVEDKLSDAKTRVIKTPSKNSRSMIARKRDTSK